jgi:hypothetical protein
MKKTLLLFVALLISIQFIPADKTNPPVDEKLKLNTKSEVMEILKKSCYDCHSNETKWPTYSNIAPFSWFIISHVRDGRKALNFSQWENIKSDIKIKRLQRAIKTTNNGSMPLPSYLKLHDKAVMSEEEKKIVVEWFKLELKKL